MAKRSLAANIMFFVLLSITIATTVVALMECYNIRKYIVEEKQVIEAIVFQNTSNSHGTDVQLKELYDSYYSNIEQKANETIDKIIAFVGSIFSITTIVNTVIALRMPNYYESRQEDLERMVKKVYSYANEAKAYAKTMSIENSKSSTREKINTLTAYILDDEVVESSELYFIRGSYYDEISDFENAERDYKRAKKFGLLESKYYNAMGVLYAKRFLYAKRRSEKFEKFFEMAKSFYLKAIKDLQSDNDASDYYCNLACLFEDNDLHDEALKYFELAIKENEDNVRVYFDRAISYEEMGKEYYQAAFEDYSRCLNLEPDYTEARLYRIDIISKILKYNNDNELRKIAIEDIDILKKDRNQLDYYEKKVKSFTDEYVDELIRKIDLKIAELEAEEAAELAELNIEESD